MDERGPPTDAEAHCRARRAEQQRLRRQRERDSFVLTRL